MNPNNSNNNSKDRGNRRDPGNKNKNKNKPGGKVNKVREQMANDIQRLQGENDGLKEHLQHLITVSEQKENALGRHFMTVPLNYEEQKVVSPVVRNQTINDAARAGPGINTAHQTVTGLPYIRNMALLNFNTLTYDQKTRKIIYGRLALWSKVAKIDDQEDWAQKALTITNDVYYERRTFYRWWNELKCYFYDTWTRIIYDVESIWHLTVSLPIAVTCFHFSYKCIKLLSDPDLSKRSVENVVQELIPFKNLKNNLITLGFLCIIPITIRYITTSNTNRTEIQKVKYVEDYCVGEICGLLEGSEGKMEVNPTLNTNCIPKQYPVGFTIAMDYIWIPRSCVHNETSAVANRQLLPPIGTPDVRKQWWDQAAELFVRDVPYMPFEGYINDEEELLDEFLLKYPQSRRNAIKTAWIDVLQGAEVNVNVKAFVKIEWNVGKAEGERYPRLISGLHDDFLSETGPVYHAWTKQQIKNLWSDQISMLRLKFIYTAGMTGDQIGAVAAHFETLGYFAVEGDLSKKDGHTEKEALAAKSTVHSHYLPERTAKLLRRNETVVGVTRNGVKYQIKGKTLSGQIDTSHGNTEEVFMMINVCMEDQEIGTYTTIVLGDDNVIFIPAQFRSKFDLNRMIEVCALMGHAMKAKLWEFNEYDYLEYCSMWFWNVGNTRVLGPKPYRVLAKTFMPHRIIKEDELISYMVGIAVGFKHFSWVPVLGKFCLHLIEANPDVKGTYVCDNPYKVVLKTEIKDVDQHCVDTQFERLYGFHPSVEDHVLECFYPIVPNMVLPSCLFIHGLDKDGITTDQHSTTSFG